MSLLDDEENFHANKDDPFGLITSRNEEVEEQPSLILNHEEELRLPNHHQVMHPEHRQHNPP